MPIVFPDQHAASHGRAIRRLLVSGLAALAVAPLASADTSDFQGVNWAVLGDNFVEDNLVLHGLDESDDYDTVRAKADVIYTGFEDNLAINAIRLPVNTHTVGSAWWNVYSGVIDAATNRDLKVILAYWEDGAASGGQIDDLDAWNAMWDTVTGQYGNSSLVYFEPMNEPHGYSATEWTDVAADWIERYSSVPKGRILVGGSGYSQDAKPICADNRLDGTLVSYHIYTFFSNEEKTYDGWAEAFHSGLGDCASRVVTTEFGSPMDDGLDYTDAGSEDNFKYWTARPIGGKITAGQSDDWYSIQKLEGTGTDLTLTTPNASGLDRLRHGWGRDSA